MAGLSTDIKVEAHWGVGRRGRSVHSYWIDDVDVGTTIQQVIAAIRSKPHGQAIPRGAIVDICGRAKIYGRALVLAPRFNDWIGWYE